LIDKTRNGRFDSLSGLERQHGTPAESPKFRRKTVKQILSAILLALIVSPGAFGQTKTASNSWTDRLQPFFGDWTAAGQTRLGSGEGGFSFRPELDGQIVVRRNFAEYKTGAAAGTRHDDLMIIYLDGNGTAGPKAMYFDSERHVIRYNLSFPRANAVVFESEASEPGPKYRLSYSLDGTVLSGKFEIAASEGDFKTYLDWTSRRLPETPSVQNK
jgi:hypothetical protein